MQPLKRINLLCIGLLASFVFTGVTYAGGIKTVTVGSPVTISWVNSGAAQWCVPSTNYPITADGVATTWITGDKYSSGSLPLGVATQVGTWTFSCWAYQGPFDPIGTLTDTTTLIVSPNPAPTVNSVSINQSPVRPNNSNQYLITVIGSADTGGASVSHAYALINYQGTNAGNYRGYLTWYFDGTYPGWDALKDKRLCSGGGLAVIQPNYGEEYLTLDSCVTSINGNTRTTTFYVRFNKLFTSPYTDNDISGIVYANGIHNLGAWQNFETNFGLLIPPAINNVRISSPVVSPNNANQYTITVDASSPVGDVGNNTVGHQYAIVNFNNGAGDGNYRGYVGWSFDNTFPFWYTYSGFLKGPAIPCTNGGWAALQGGYPGAGMAQGGYGSEYMNLISCSTSLNSTGPGNGNDSRSTEFVVSFEPSFTTPTTNTLWGWTQNGYEESSPWVSFNTFNLVSGSLNVSSCLIPAGSGSCTQPLSWTTVNPNGVSSVTSDTPAPNTVIYSSNSGWLPANTVSGPPGTKNYYLYNSGSLLDTKSTTIACTPGTNWVATSSRCVGTPLATPTTGTMNVASCIILPGASSCFQPLGWDTINPVDTSEVRSNYPAPRSIYTSNSGWLPNNTVTGVGTQEYYLYNDGNLLSTVVASSSCAIGTSWDGSNCTGPMSGILSVSTTSCRVSTGNSNCRIDATWGTTNPQATSSITRNYPNPNQTMYTGNNGGPSPIWISAGAPSVGIFLYNNAVELDRKTITATCAVGGWDTVSRTCVDPRVVTVTINPYITQDPDITLRCSGSDNYIMEEEAGTGSYTVFATGSTTGGIATGIARTTGNYRFTCKKGIFAGPPVVVYHDNTPSPTAMFGNLSADRSSCTVPTGSDSCTANLTWNVTNPEDPLGSVISRNYPTPGQIMYTADSGTSQPVTVSAGAPAVGFFLYNNARLLDAVSVSATCSTGGFDTVSDTCRNPRITQAEIDGNYMTNPGSIRLSCSGSSNWRIEQINNVGAVIGLIDSGAYLGPVVRSTVGSGDSRYRLTCSYGSLSDSANINYYDVVDTSVIDLQATPSTVNADENTTLSWRVRYPVATCSLTAKVICPNNLCNARQTAYETSLNSILTGSSTDLNDPATSRSIPIAVGIVAPGQNATQLALGKKTIKMSYTTDFTYDCTRPAGAVQKKTKRVNVTNSVER